MASPFTHVPRASWTATDLSELDIEDMLETWEETVTDYVASYAGEGLASPTFPTSPPLASPRLPRTSSLLRLQPTTLSPMQPAVSSFRLAVDSERRPSNASLIDSSSRSFDAYRFPSSADTLSPPSPSSPAELFPSSDSPPSGREDMLELDDFFGAPRASPFPTFGQRVNARPDVGGAIRAFAKRLEANLPPPPVPPNRRPSIAPSTSTTSSSSSTVSRRTAASKGTSVYTKFSRKKDKKENAHARPQQAKDPEDDITRALRANWMMMR